MMATIMPVTVFAKRAMEDRTAKLLLEKVSFFHVVPCMWVECASAHAYVHVYVRMECMCVFEPKHYNALDIYPFVQIVHVITVATA